MAIKKRGTRGKKKTKKKTSAKRSKKTKKAPSRPRAPVAKAVTPAVAPQLFAMSATTTISDDVVAILMNEFNVSQSQASSKKLSDMVAGCGTSTLVDLARAHNEHWPSLDPKFAASDLSCSDTADTLAVKVNQRLP